MNTSDRIFLKKLSIYDLLVAKNKNKEKCRKEILKKQLSQNLSDIVEVKSNNQEKLQKISQNLLIKDEEILNNFSEGNLKADLNVILEGKSVQDNLVINNNYNDDKDNFLIMKMQESVGNIETNTNDLDPPSYNSNGLALLIDLGTTQKYKFFKRKEKLVPISTLKLKSLPISHANLNRISKQNDINENQANDICDSSPLKESEEFSNDLESDENLDMTRVKKRYTIRSVEEILTSLKSDDYIQSQIESDKRIDNLIRKVLERTDEEENVEEEQSNLSDLVNQVSNDLLPIDRTTVVSNEEDIERVIQKLETDRSKSEALSESQIEIYSDKNHLKHGITTENADKIKTENKEIAIDQLLLDLRMDDKVTKEDLLGVRGIRLETKEFCKESLQDLLYKEHIMTDKADVHQGIHDLCTMHDYIDSSVTSSKQQWIENYVPDRFPSYKENMNKSMSSSSVERIEKAAERIINQKNEIEKWRMKANEMLNLTSDIEIVGTFISPNEPKINDIWQPLAPRLFMSANKVKNFLCPKYNHNIFESSIEEVSKQNTFENFTNDDLSLSNEASFCNEIDLDALETKEKLLSRKINSVECLINERIDENKPFNVTHGRKRRRSVPNRHWLEEDSLIVHLEYHQIMDEINVQRQKILALKNTSKNIDDIEEMKPLDDEEKILNDDFDSNVLTTNAENNFEAEQSVKILQDISCSPAEKALRAGRNYIYYPPKKRSKSKTKKSKNIARISDIEKFLGQQPNKLDKTKSFENILNELKRVQSSKSIVRSGLKKSLSKSLTNIHSFEVWSKERGYKKENNARDWITVIWDQWFDEIYPPVPDSIMDLISDKAKVSETPSKKEALQRETTSVSVNHNEILDLPEYIEPTLEEVDEEFREDLINTLIEEVENISKDMGNYQKPNAFLLSRRGALRRKLGYLAAASKDINDAISVEPDLITAYWERHLLHLVCNKVQLAIEDLNLILKKDKNYVLAYKSRAGIYASTGDFSLAISNLSQAIRLSSDDSEAYSKRAELYELNGEGRLALEDYNQIIRLQPNNCLAMMKHGLYYLNIEQWQLAVKDFSNVLRHYPNNTEAWLHRGTAYAKLQQWQDALTDFSAVIHLDPNNYLAYFKRGCLLRKAEPYLAIRDFSISLLLESSEENIMSYMYRGILYATTKQFSEAIVDFEVVICFNKDMCFAHVNLGLIYFENGDYEKAIKYMTSGLAADPMYIRAYPCRAEAYFKMNKYENAIKDINRAIHLFPDRSNFYMLRGDFYLSMGKMEMAAICVRQAAEISHNLGQSPVQQALVHSFLQNYDQAIDALLVATRGKPSIALLNLLGTTQMKAKRWKDAITSFTFCLEQLKPKNQYKPWPPGAANLYFLVARCYLELKNYKQSQLAFSATVKINPNHAEAYYHQGWCRLRLGKMKQGILDLNNALAINPKLYQAYLARATLFGFKNQYTKAILNCNEVLSIEPRCLRAYLYRGVLKYKIKAYSLAIKDFTEAIKIDANCILAFFNRAVCFNAEKKNYEKAIQDYSIVLLINDALQLHYKSFINRGLVYLELGDVQNALHDFIRAQGIQPNDVYVLYVVGLCYHKLKNLKEAIRVFTRCLDYDPKFILAKVSRGNVFMDYNSSNSRELAAKDYNSVLEIDSYHLDALVNLGFCRQAQGKFKQAWDIFTMAIEKHPNSERPLDGRAIVCMQMSNLNGALKDLNEAIRIQPQSSVLYINRGVVYQLMRDGIRAMKDYNKAIIIGGSKCPIAYFNAGCVYVHNYQLQQALECFNKTVEINPSDEAGWINLALVYIFQNKLEESIEYIDKSISLAPNVAYLYLNRANVLFDLQRYQEAECDFCSCLRIAPDDPRVLKARGDCRSKLGNSMGALDDYKTSVYISSSIQRIHR